MNFGYGLGPGIAGHIRQYELDHGLGRSIFLTSIVGMTVISLLLLLPVAARLDRASRAAQNP